MPPPGRRRRLGDLLIEAGLISEQDLKAALNEQRKWGGRLGRTVVELGFVTETSMAQVLAQQLELPMVDLDATSLPPDVATHLRLDLCERYGVFPLARNAEAKTLSLATADPTNGEQLKAIEFAINGKVLPTVATASAIERAIRRYYFGEPVETQPPGLAPAEQRTSTGELRFELDALVGEAAPAPAPSRGTPGPAQAATGSDSEVALRAENTVLRERVDTLEELNASQAKALRVLLEILIESGLVTRDEYLERLHAPD